MKKILGLDMGTNSIGWAVVEQDKDQFTLLDKGVRIFQEGVKIEKGIESSRAAERRGYRSARRLKYRRRLRKIATLKVLSEFGFCPRLDNDELEQWRHKKTYPKNQQFIDWWRTSDADNKNPYYFRHLAASQKLELNNEANRFIIGRAFYHMTQRRGFLSNRLVDTKESEGEVKKSIDQITKAKGDKTLGQYFYEKYVTGEKIRDQYTHREEHYLEEFNRICEVQVLEEKLIRELHNAIFYQRDLKSQKSLIGRCVFEPRKQRCSVSHPLYEEYRMLCFVNNIKIKTPEDEKLRFLNDDERKIVIQRFYLKKDHFEFEEIAKYLAPKKQYKYAKDRDVQPEDYLFNYRMNTTVSGNPVSARLKGIFGDDFLDYSIDHIREKDDVTSSIDIYDVWHVLKTFKDDNKLEEFAREKLKLDNDQLNEFCKIRMKNDFASLSIKAITKMLPYLRQGMIYSHAVLLANMPEVLPDGIWNDPEARTHIYNKVREIIQTQNQEKALIETVNGMIKRCRENGECWSEEGAPYFRSDIVKGLEVFYGERTYASFSPEVQEELENSAVDLFKKQMSKNLDRGEFVRVRSIDERVREFLVNDYEADKEIVKKLYHPSAIEVYKPLIRAEDGKKYLGSPMVSSIRNPMAMRALHQLRKVINELIKHEIIDENTRVNIEMSRDLLNANERAALQRWQRDRETERKNYAEKIKEHYVSQGINTEPSKDDILKYQLWEEQEHKCIYTGEEIGLSEFLGANPVYDIEHTLPRSATLDNSQENKTLCNNRYNRSVKRNKIPYELPNHNEICALVEKLWKDKIEDLEKQIQGALKQTKGQIEKDAKDRAIQKRHRLVFEKDYWRGKLSRFFMKDIPQGFKNSQLVDIGIITKYARLYLKNLFGQVYTVKGNTVADFRIMWGLQNHFEKKSRVNHIHHCIDAIVIACMTKENYENLAKYYHEQDDAFNRDSSGKTQVKKPWKTFTQDIKNVEEEVLISHYTPDVLPKHGRKKLRKGGRIVKNKYGQVIYQTGDTVRGRLHKDTFYGAIEQVVDGQNGGSEKQIKYVLRKPLDSLDDEAIKHIVDDRVRDIVKNARKQEKVLRKEIESLKKKLSKADEHEEPAINEEIQKIAQQITKLYTLPNKHGDPVPIKKVRIYTPAVKNPIELKKHRDKSSKNPKSHKELYYVVNDGNYLMAIYEGQDKNGRVKRDFEIRTNLKAGEFFKHSVRAELKPQGIDRYEYLVPESKISGSTTLPLKTILKTGTKVVFWKNNPDEIFSLSDAEIKNRLYRIVQFEGDGRIRFRFHQVSMPYSSQNQDDLTIKSFMKSNQLKDSVVDFDNPIPALRLTSKAWNFLVEEKDFKISPLGSFLRIGE